MQIRIFSLAVVCAAVLLSASLEHAQAQLTPLPDPIGGGGTGTGGTGTGCGCQTRLLSSTAMATIGPDFNVVTIDQDLKPGGFTADPAADEWWGDDELYRVANASVKKLSPTSGSIRVNASQGFEIYGDLFAADPGFPSNHVHPSASIHGEFEFKTNGLHLDPVGISLNGNVTATGSASVHGSVIPDDFFYHADASASASLNVEASHPFPNCPGGTEKIKETISMSGGVNTTSETSGSVSITVGTATKTTTKEKGEESTDNGVTLGLMNSVTLTDTAFSASAGLTGILNVVGSTNSPIVRIPVVLVATTSGAGTADMAYSTGNGSASSNFVWSGSAMPCAMPDPTITPPPTPPPTTPTPPPTTPTPPPTTP